MFDPAVGDILTVRETRPADLVTFMGGQFYVPISHSMRHILAGERVMLLSLPVPNRIGVAEGTDGPYFFADAELLYNGEIIEIIVKLDDPWNYFVSLGVSDVVVHPDTASTLIALFETHSAREKMRVRLLTPKWSNSIMSDLRCEPLCVVNLSYTGAWAGTLRVPASKPDGTIVQLPLSFDVQLGEPDAEFDADGNCLTIRKWGLARLDVGTWAVSPSIVEPRYDLHAYVILCDVPSPAPWELSKDKDQDTE